MNICYHSPLPSKVTLSPHTSQWGGISASQASGAEHRKEPEKQLKKDGLGSGRTWEGHGRKLCGQESKERTLRLPAGLNPLNPAQNKGGQPFPPAQDWSGLHPIQEGPFFKKVKTTQTVLVSGNFLSPWVTKHVQDGSASVRFLETELQVSWVLGFLLHCSCRSHGAGE